MDQWHAEEIIVQLQDIKNLLRDILASLTEVPAARAPVGECHDCVSFVPILESPDLGACSEGGGRVGPHHRCGSFRKHRDEDA